MAATPQDIAQALKYGPKAQGLMRRSAYLDRALAQMQEQGAPIRSPWELAAKLAATAILSRASNKAQDATTKAVYDNRNERLARLMANLPEAPVSPPPPTPLMQAPPPPQQSVAAPVAPAPQPQPAPEPAATAEYTPQDRDAMIRMLATEAGGEDPTGIAAAGHVALNRLRSGYGGAKSLRDVVMAPNQFEGMSRANQVSPQDYERVAQIADGILSGQVPDPTGGAVNFLNPDLQTQLGRQIPAWAQGQGQRIGRHVFFGGKPQSDVRMAAGPAPAGPMQVQQQFPSGGAEPYQVASVGATPPPPSAPELSPPGPGAPPAAPPQAAAGGNPTMYQPTVQEVMLVKRLLQSGDPEEQAKGEALYWKLQEKMVQPQEWKPISVNGLPALQNPYTGEIRLSQVPEGARTRTRGDVPGLIPGTVAQEDPTGKLSVIQAPPVGFQGAPDRLMPTQGGPQDPNAGQNLIAGEGRLRDDYEKLIKDYSAARENYQKVVQAAATGTPAGDIALVFAYMKTLDPGSTVREGEAATIQNSGTVPQTVTNMYNKLLTGEGRLLPEQRGQFADSARQQFQVYQRTADQLNERYGELAKSYGYDPSRIVRQFPAIDPYKPQAASQSPVPEVAIKKWREYATNQGAPLGSPDHPFLARDEATLQGLDKPENRGKWVVGPDGRKGQIQ
jgi:spore germination cell wall hydrolase CwlJ-like protein